MLTKQKQKQKKMYVNKLSLQKKKKNTVVANKVEEISTLWFMVFIIHI
jgi:hypothetical protein